MLWSKDFDFKNTFSFIHRYSLIFNHASATEWQENSQIAKLFKDAGVEGTFVLFDVSQDSFTGFNHKRAKQRFIPASTFKVANSLIGLSTGAVESVDEILPYGGKSQFIKAWENDMSLRDAIKISNVPIYQETSPPYRPFRHAGKYC